ncbi:MAG: ACP S-malonyltransferase [Kiritimatiellales bacterium]|nr:ACP S-malonyltransferase [Kiritimatiellales bacterium]MCF7863683.1 ACP S-malonyltransferase [Kiritimatiellales bacterium]
MKRAIVFPGQGSQIVGMGKDFTEAIPQCKTLFDQANEILGYDLATICFDGPQDELNKSNHAQLGIFVASVAAFRALEIKQPDLEYQLLAGHSLGEWTALHIAGVVGFEDTIRILRARGEAMQAACEANPGAMLAVMGVDGDDLLKIAVNAGCYVANFNSLGQTVLSGTADSIGKAEELMKAAGAKRAIRLPVAGGFHSPLMQPAADIMTDFLAGIEFSGEKVPVLSNVTAQPHGNASVKDDMVKQITSSVQWVSIIQWMAANGVEEIIECGPGKVLAGLIKRIDKNCPVRNIGQLIDLEKE